MRIGLIDIEPKIFNTALMQIAEYYRNNCIEVRWVSSLEYHKYDTLYCSSIFTYTDKSQIPKRTICGGTGFDIKKRLPTGIARTGLDYTIYPKCRTSFIWFSRGCIRNCSFCIVRQKEGPIRPVKINPNKYINPEGKYITVMDNNFFANPKWESAIWWLRDSGQPLNFQGIDARLLTKEMCSILNELKHYKQIKIAWDNPKEMLEKKLREITKYIKPYKLMCYVLIGFNSTEAEDLSRVETLRKLKIDPFVMPYYKKDLYQRAFARWVNHKAIFKKVKWEDYKQRVNQQEAAGCGWKS